MVEGVNASMLIYFYGLDDEKAASEELKKIQDGIEKY